MTALAWAAGLAAGPVWRAAPALAAAGKLEFGELYGKMTPISLEFSDKVKSLVGREVSMRGYMAPPLKAEAKFFVLAEIPMAMCPFCSSDADWPDNIVVVYLDHAQTFETADTLIEVSGRLETGSWTDPDTGFVSQLRIVSASFGRA